MAERTPVRRCEAMEGKRRAGVRAGRKGERVAEASVLQVDENRLVVEVERVETVDQLLAGKFPAGSIFHSPLFIGRCSCLRRNDLHPTLRT